MKMLAGILLVLVLAGLSAIVQAQSDEGLVAEWRFDEGSGKVATDSSGNGNNGVIYGASWVDGKFGKALYFDGMDDYVEVPYSSSFDVHGTSHTALGWIKIVGKLGTRTPIFCQDDWGIGVWMDKTGSIRAHTNTGNAIPYLDTTWTIDTTSWHQIGQIYDGTNLHIILDDQIIASGITKTATGRPWSASSFMIGYSTVWEGHPWSGVIDKVRIYNRALTTDEIKAHYEGKQTALALTKSALPHSIKQGQTTTVTLTVKNTGTTEIKDLEVADSVPADFIVISRETSKKYSSLKSGESRDFQFVIQSSESGTFNLCEATATYVDIEGNFYTVKSNTATINVIRSLEVPAPTSSTPTPIPIPHVATTPSTMFIPTPKPEAVSTSVLTPAPLSRVTPTSTPTPTPTSTPAPSASTPPLYLIGAAALIAIIIIVGISRSRKGKSNETTKPQQPPKPEHTIEPAPTKPESNIFITSAFGYKGATIVHKIKVENPTSEPVSDIKIHLFVPDVFLLKEQENNIGLLKPKESKTVTFEIRPTGECGDCEVSGRVTYYDYATKKTKEVDIPAKTLSIVCPVLKLKIIDEAAWRLVVSELAKTEESTKEINMPAKTLFEVASDILRDMNMFMLPPTVTETPRHNRIF